MNHFKIIISIIILIVTLFIGRILYFQVITDKYKLRAETTSIKPDVQIPIRGLITDRKGKILVENTPLYEITYTENLMPKDEIFDTIEFCNLLRISKEQYINIMDNIKKMYKNKRYNKVTPVTFLKNLNPSDLVLINEKIFLYKAFNVVRRHDRNYLVNSAGNILGYTNEVDDNYIKRDPDYYKPGDFAGMAGVEKSYEKELRGVKGVKYIQKDIRGRNLGPYKDGEYDIEVQPGKDLTLTIDYELQKFAEDLLVNKIGAIVAIDPNNGEILAMASSPTINPSLFKGRDKNKHIRELQLDSINKPMFDRSTQAAYPPGSTFKPINGLASMQMQVINSSTTFICKHGFHYGNRVLNCLCNYYYQPISISMAIQKSCNSFFAETYMSALSKYPNDIDKSLDEWSDIVKSFGLGDYMNNDLANGSKGLIPTSTYYNKAFKKGRWNRFTIVSNAIGQGEILATPLQIANYAAAISNYGFFYTPHIVKEIDHKPIKDDRFIKPKYTKVDRKYFEVVNKGLENVVLYGGASRIQTPLFTQKGKTGTSQVLGKKDNAVFMLMAPADKPKIVVSVVLENGGFGATYAAPSASLVAEKYLTGEISREELLNNVLNGDFRSEYKKNWYNYLEKNINNDQ